MNVMRLHGKIGKREGIVFIRNKYDVKESTVWHVSLHPTFPNELHRAKVIKQIR